MSFVKINNNNIEYTGIKLFPSTHFISSSIGEGVTGSNYVSPFRSKVFKKLKVDTFDLDGDGSVNIGEFLAGVLKSPEYFLKLIEADPSNLDAKLRGYMSSIGLADTITKNTKTVDVFRFDQPVLFNKNRNIKNVVRKSLMPYHVHRYQNCNFSYTNYNTLNFFSSDTIPSGSALIYPNVSESYDLNDQFSLNFWVNPRYSESGTYNPGTIFHLSSSLCVSLISGSSKDHNNSANDFKILVQLSQSCDTPPSQIDFSNLSYPNDLVFTSSMLQKNSWHHVCVQWGNNINNNTGSIFIDDTETKFYVPSASLSAPSDLSPPGIVVGNYFDAFYDTMSSFLNETKAAEQGFESIVAGAGITDPIITENMLNHPLQAEIHELKLYNKVLFDISEKTFIKTERKKVMDEGVVNFDNLTFYVPPFFYPTTPTREVLSTPFQTITDKTDDPFNVAFSFGVNGKLINLENFTRDFATNRHPRLLGMFPQTIDTTIEDITADQYVYNSGSLKKRNMTILPNDNGLFSPNYDIYNLTTARNNIKFLTPDTDNHYDYSTINLENLIPTSSLFPGLTFTTGSIFDQIVGASPENPGVAPGSVLTIAQRTRDVSSNEIVIYDISNLYYGNRIKPGSFEIIEDNLTGSDGKVKIKIRDNERGSLYRADSLTPHAKWNNIGNILYDEGIAIVKTPHLFYLSKDKTELRFKGEQNIHTMMINIPVLKDQFVSSSHPEFINIPPSTAGNNQDLKTIYVTTVNIHDENLNIIMKANFSQPIFKTEEDDFIIRLKEDF